MHRRVGVLLFTAGWGANHFSTLLVVYRKALGLSPAELGILFGAYALGLVPGLMLAGRASDKWGRRALVMPASVLAIVASAVLAFGTQGFTVLLVGRLLFGMGMGAVMSPGSVWVQELSPPGLGPRRATLALSAGFGLGPLVSGLIAELAPSPMVLPYVAHGVVMVAALHGVRVVPETASGVSPRGEAREASGLPPARVRLRDMGVLVELLPVAPWAFGLAAVTLAILPGLMRPLVSRPVLFSAFVILTTLSTGVFVQRFVKRVGRRGDLLGLGAGALGVLLAAHAVAIASPALVFVVAVLVGAGYGLVMTTGLAEVGARVPPQARGSAVGLYYVLTYLGFALPFIHATLAKRWGDAPTLRGSAVAAFVCLIVRAIVESRSRAVAPAS
ncbi:MAG TPA: MFS transporter [Polyangia bacterium]|jgi:MFS family permease